MKYFNNPQSVGELKAQHDRMQRRLEIEHARTGDTDKYFEELKVLETENAICLKALRKEYTAESHMQTQYFKSPKTLDELDAQYRVFIKKLSNQAGGDKVLAKIEKEYKMLQKEIKYNSGQYTMTQKLHRDLYEMNEERKYKERQRAEQMWSYQNKAYTKNDLQNLINEQKQILYKAIDIYLKKGIIAPFKIESMSNADALNVIVKKVARLSGLDKEFIAVAEESAYAMQSIAKRNNVSLSKLSHQMEEIVGGYAKKTYLALEEKYADPIKVYNRNKNIKSNDKMDKLFLKAMIILTICTIPIIIIALMMM